MGVGAMVEMAVGGFGVGDGGFDVTLMGPHPTNKKITSVVPLARFNEFLQLISFSFLAIMRLHCPTRDSAIGLIPFLPARPNPLN
jgi:hypothetical protein